MGKSSNSHGKKSDKETQSPMLKIFRDMMQRENVDPEKAKLLKEKRKNKKRKQYSTSKSDLGKSGDSSANDKNKMHYNVLQGHKGRYSQSQHTHSFPISSDKRDSWLCWGESKERESVDGNPKNEETCSCVSCALKRVVGNEYACVGCLLFLFIISVVLAFLLVCKTIPIATEKLDEPGVYNSKISKTEGSHTSDDFKKTIEMMTDKNYFGTNLRGRRNGDSSHFWDNSLSRQLGELGSFSDLSEDFGDTGLLESNGQRQTGRVDAARAGIVLDASKLTNGRLKNFYKKLIQADIQIKNLKKGYYSKLSTSMSPFLLKQLPSFFPERLKRSLFYRKPRVKVTVKNQNGTEIIKRTLGDNLRVRRFHNGSVVPSGFLFEKKKLFIQYMPAEKKIFAKCSHAPKESKSHEHQLKHPFYKNTQRLDEMLDQFLDKSFPEILNCGPSDEKKKPCHHEPVHKNPMQYVIDSTDRVYNKLVRPNVGRAKKIKNELMKMLIDTTLTPKKELTPTHRSCHTRSPLTHYVHTTHVNHVRKEGVRETSNNIDPTENYDLVLSISTLINPIARRLSSADYISKKPGRKLQQFDEDEEEAVGYDDLKEVLSDDMANHDETDRQVERRKRDDVSTFENEVPTPKIKYNPPGVHNPNWKGPMPLYPDELNTMMKHDTNKDPETEFKNVLLDNTTDLRWLGQRRGSFHEGQETDLEDVQYIEDYAQNKYDLLVQMAQAYSDYGVLDLKKEQNDKNQVSKEKKHRVKLAADDQNFHGGLFGRPKKARKKSATSHSKTGSESEGIRFEIRGHAQGDNKPTELFQALSKHMKIADDDRIHKHGFHSTTLLPVHSELDSLHSSDGLDTTTKEEKSNELENRFNFGVWKRSLVSRDDNNVSRDLVKKDSDIIHFKSRNLKFIDVISDYDTGDIFQVTENNIDGKQEVTSKVRAKRNVKSIDIDNEKVAMDQNSNIRVTPTSDEGNLTNIVNITEDFSSKKNSANETKVMNNTEDINIVVKQNNTKNALMDANEFFIMLSNWFGSLSLLANETGTLKNTESNSTNQTLRSNITTKNCTTDKTTIYLEYPLYDTDMIDNIGHRSRVLLSVEEHANISDAKPVKIKDVKETNVSGEENTDVLKALTVAEKSNYVTTKVSTMPANINATDQKENKITSENQIDDNKTVVKRSAQDGNLIFWNDMYDEEYGIQQDPLENTLREKHYLEDNLLKKPKKWFQDKVKKLTDNVKKCNPVEIRGDKPKKKTLLGRLGIAFQNKETFKNQIESVTSSHSIVKRNDDVDEDETDDEQQPSSDKEINFAILTNHMKQVMKEAAKSIRQTKNLEVREDRVTGTITAGLMQQLVKMMSDLVDFQVQQKTCLQLPSDLKNFLTWLTHGSGNGPGPPNALISKAEGMEDVGNDEPGWKGEQSTIHMDMVANPSSENEAPDSRSECLGTLQTLQELMQQYKEMTDEDKSKMTGVKEYLEYQLNFLNKKLNGYDDQLSESNWYTNAKPFRYRRDTNTNIEKPQMYIHRHRGKRRNHRRSKRKLNRFLRNYGKKHTRTTAGNIEFVVSTDVEKKREDVVNNEEEDFKFKREIKNGEDVHKRNLIDVYYKALADAKKLSTEKVIHKKDFGFDKAEVVRLQN